MKRCLWETKRKDMDIYAKIQEQDYRTVFDRYGSELTIQEIISKCTNA